MHRYYSPSSSWTVAAFPRLISNSLSRRLPCLYVPVPITYVHFRSNYPLSEKQTRKTSFVTERELSLRWVPPAAPACFTVLPARCKSKNERGRGKKRRKNKEEKRSFRVHGLLKPGRKNFDSPVVGVRSVARIAKFSSRLVEATTAFKFCRFKRNPRPLFTRNSSRWNVSIHLFALAPLFSFRQFSLLLQPTHPVSSKSAISFSKISSAV